MNNGFFFSSLTKKSKGVNKREVRISPSMWKKYVVRYKHCGNSVTSVTRNEELFSLCNIKFLQKIYSFSMKWKLKSCASTTRITGKILLIKIEIFLKGIHNLCYPKFSVFTDRYSNFSKNEKICGKKCPI